MATCGARDTKSPAPAGLGGKNVFPCNAQFDALGEGSQAASACTVMRSRSSSRDTASSRTPPSVAISASMPSHQSSAPAKRGAGGADAAAWVAAAAAAASACSICRRHWGYLACFAVRHHVSHPAGGAHAAP